MARERAKIVGLAAIDRGIKALGTRLENINTDVQELAVAIIEHAKGDGNGDVSRALTLCKMVARHRTLNVAFLVGFFRHFGSININLRANDGAGKVSLMSKDAKGYRGYDVDGARANNWSEAFNDKGERAPWYAGPEPAEFQPMGIGDLAQRMNNFVKNTAKLLTDTKTVKGKDVPVVQLAEGDQKQVEAALLFISRIAGTLARHEELNTLEGKLAEAKAAVEQDNEVVEVLQHAGEEAQQDRAVA